MPFSVISSGHYPVDENDVGIRFYIQILSTATSVITVVKAHEPECCWTVEEGDVDCQSMELFGGFPQTIHPGTRRNISYVFSNIYPMDRTGICKFFLRENVSLSTQSIQHRIAFDTTDSQGAGLSAMIFGSGRPSCRGVDENARNSCYPYNCVKRYNGARNYYRVETRKCEPVVKCRTQLGKDNLPTSAFDFENNRCKSLLPKSLRRQAERVVDNMMTKSELAKEAREFADVLDPSELLIDCKHGQQIGQICRCDEGWRTASVSTVNGGLEMDWCSRKVKIPVKKLDFPGPPVALKFVVISILLVVSSSLVYLLAVLWWNLLLKKLFYKLLGGYWGERIYELIPFMKSTRTDANTTTDTSCAPQDHQSSDTESYYDSSDDSSSTLESSAQESSDVKIPVSLQESLSSLAKGSHYSRNGQGLGAVEFMRKLKLGGSQHDAAGQICSNTDSSK